MRYHWGLGIGHLHAHQSTSSYQPMVIDAPHEQVSESLSVGRDTKTTDLDECFFCIIVDKKKVSNTAFNLDL